MECRFSRVINTEVKYYGLARLGIVFGALFSIITVIFLVFMFGFAGSVPGYIVRSYLSGHLHSGRLQRFCYWNLSSILFVRYEVPPSYRRSFM